MAEFIEREAAIKDVTKNDVCNVGEEETRTPYCPNCGALMDKEVDDDV